MVICGYFEDISSLRDSKLSRRYCVGETMGPLDKLTQEYTYSMPQIDAQNRKWGKINYNIKAGIYVKMAINFPLKFASASPQKNICFHLVNIIHLRDITQFYQLRDN